MSLGPLVAALVGVPAGHIVDRIGARRTRIVGLVAMSIGSLGLSLTRASPGALGYVLPLVILTAGYALFQAANNTATMSEVRAEERGVISGALTLARNLGLITGAALMGAIFAHGDPTANVFAASPHAVTAGLHATFAIARLLVIVALAIAIGKLRLRRGEAAFAAQT